jgi:hypothetical protein
MATTADHFNKTRGISRRWQRRHFHVHHMDIDPAPLTEKCQLGAGFKPPPRETRAAYAGSDAQAFAVVATDRSSLEL